MDYLVFLSAVLLVLALCGLLLIAGSRRDGSNVGVRDRGRRAAASDLEVPRPRVPGSRRGAREEASARSGGNGSPGLSPGNDERLRNALARWVDSLVAQKRTVAEDTEYRSRTHNSLRALVEDRYGGRASRRTDRAGRQSHGRRVSPPGRSGGGVSGVKRPWGW